MNAAGGSLFQDTQPTYGRPVRAKCTQAVLFSMRRCLCCWALRLRRMRLWVRSVGAQIDRRDELHGEHQVVVPAPRGYPEYQLHRVSRVFERLWAASVAKPGRMHLVCISTRHSAAGSGRRAEVVRSSSLTFRGRLALLRAPAINASSVSKIAGRARHCAARTIVQCAYAHMCMNAYLRWPLRMYAEATDPPILPTWQQVATKRGIVQHCGAHATRYNMDTPAPLPP